MKFERTKNAIRNIGWAGIQKIISIFLPFVFRTVMIYTLGAEYLGINSLFSSILQVLSLSELGFHSAVVFSMYEPISKNDTKEVCALLNYYKRIYLYIGCVILGVGLLLTPFITIFIAGDYPSDINIYFVYIVYLLNTSVSYFLFAYRSSILVVLQRNDVHSKISLFVSILRYTLEIIGIYITHMYYLFLCIELFSTIISNCITYIVTKHMFPQYTPRGKINKSKKDEIKSNVTALMFHKIGGIVLNSTDTIILSAFMGVVVVANYSNYYYIMNSISGIIVTCFSAITSGIGNSFVTETPEKNKDNFNKILFLNGWIVGWCSTCFICLYQDFMRLWVGEEYMFTNFIVLLFVIYFFVHTIRRTILIFRDAAGMWRENRWQPIVSAIFNLVVNIILVNIIGVPGILISSIASMVLIDIPWESHAFCKLIGMKNSSYILNLIYYFMVTIFTAICTLAICSLVKIVAIKGFLLKIIICIIIPNIILYLFFRKKYEFQYYFNLTKNWIVKK